MIETGLATNTIHRRAELWSTARGYDVLILRTGNEYGEQARKFRRYENVTAASMRRYYRLTRHYIDYSDTRLVSWSRYQRLFPITARQQWPHRGQA